MIIILLVLTIFCAFLATQTSRLLHATLWLAGVSALTSTMFYLIGAWKVAVVELSVGAGLVTILVVFAITMIGDEQQTVHIKRLPLALIVLMLLLILILTVPLIPLSPSINLPILDSELWQNRELDLLVQITLIFAGVLGVLGLLRASDTDEKTETVDVSDKLNPIAEREAVS